MINNILLRVVTESDLPIFFEQQLDLDARHMAAFTSKDSTDRLAFLAHWAQILNHDTNTNMTVLFEGQVAGHIGSFKRLGEAEITYWIGKQYWGKGIATEALSQFLHHLKARPLYARAATDNIASIRVLEKCGFTIYGYDKGFSNARGEEVEEVIMILRASS